MSISWSDSGGSLKLGIILDEVRVNRKCNVFIADDTVSYGFFLIILHCLSRAYVDTRIRNLHSREPDVSRISTVHKYRDNGLRKISWCSGICCRFIDQLIGQSGLVKLGLICEGVRSYQKCNFLSRTLLSDNPTLLDPRSLWDSYSKSASTRLGCL